MIKLPECNLLLKGLGLDTNGNEVVKLKIGNYRGFSIQTNGNLPKTKHILNDTSIYGLSDKQLLTIAAEICQHMIRYEKGANRRRLATRIYILRTYEDLKKHLCDKTQITFNALRTGRLRTKNHGWKNIHGLDDILEDAINQVTALIGGRKQDVVRRKLPHARHWALDRFIYSFERQKWVYIAGQDYTYEMNALRRYLYNL